MKNAESTGFDPQVRSFRRKPIIVLCLVTGAAATVYLAFFLSRDRQTSPPRLIGSVWRAAADGVTRLYFVTKEDRERTRSFDSDGAYTYNLTYSVYTLHARDARSGAGLAAIPIARIATTSPDFKKYQAYITLPDGPGILGPQGGVLWLWNDGPEARDLRNLVVSQFDSASSISLTISAISQI